MIERIVSFVNSYRVLTNIVVIVIGLLTITVFANQIRERKKIQTGKAANPAHLFISPETQTLPPDATFSIKVDTGNISLAFAHIEISFDQEMINLYQDILPTEFYTLISATSKEEANATGHAVVILGATPGGANPQSGVFDLAYLWFTPATQLPNQTTQIQFIEPALQLVDVNAVPFTITTSHATLTLNPVATTPTLTPRPTSTPTPTNTPTPRPTPTNTSTPTPRPTSTPTPRPTRTPTPTPTRPPGTTSTPTLAPTATIVPIPTPTPPQAETVIITKAELRRYFKLFGRLKVEATSSLAPNVELTAEGYGKLRYSKGKKLYRKTFWTLSRPLFITVTSSGGGSATAEVIWGRR